MRRFFLACMILFIAACAPKPALQTHFSPGVVPEPILQSSTVTVTLTPNQTIDPTACTEAFWAVARSQGMREIGNAFIRQAAFVRGIDNRAQDQPLPDLFITSGNVQPDHNKPAADYRQDATITATFVPQKHMAGEIIRLHDNRYIASTNDRVILRMYASTKITPPAFFLIAKKISDNKLPFLKISGWGKIVQSLQAAPPDPKHNSGGTLVQAELMETSQEIEQGDIVFLLQVKAEAIPPHTPALTPTAPSASEVMVEPQWVPEVQLPEETK